MHRAKWMYAIVETTLGYFYSLAFALPEILLLLGIHAWYRQQGS